MTKQRKRDLSVALLLLPVFFYIDYISNLQKALVTMLSLYVFYILISENWNIRGNRVFQLTILIFASLHIILIFFFKFTTFIHPTLLCWPIAMADFYIMNTAITWIEKRFGTA